MVVYDVPDGIPMRTIELGELPADWAMRQTSTQGIGDTWLDSGDEVVLSVPSVIVPLAHGPDRNVLINDAPL